MACMLCIWGLSVRAALKRGAQGSSPCRPGVAASWWRCSWRLFSSSPGLTHSHTAQTCFDWSHLPDSIPDCDSWPNFGVQPWTPTLRFNNLSDFPHVDSPALVSDWLLPFAPTPIPIPFVFNKGPWGISQPIAGSLHEEWVTSHMLLSSLGFLYDLVCLIYLLEWLGFDGL